MAEPSVGSGNAPRTVLLVDEDPVAARLVRAGLQGPGFQLLGTVRAAECLEWAARHKPELILLELRFPDADGLELLQQLQQGQETAGCPVAVLTSDKALHRHVNAIQLGAVDCACKPVEGDALVQWIEATLLRARARKSASGSAAASELLVLLLQRIEKRGTSGQLVLRQPKQTARISFRAGRLDTAECGSLTGYEAVMEIARQGKWELAFQEGATSPEDELVEAFDDEVDTVDLPPAGRAWLPERGLRARSSPARLAPEAALTPLGAVPEGDDHTIVDPSNPLLRLDLDTDPVTLPPLAPRPGWCAEKMATTVKEAALEQASTDEMVEDQLTPTSDVPPALREALDVARAAPLQTQPVIAAPERDEAAARQPHQPGVAPAGERSDLKCWLEEVGRTPLLLIIPDDRVRSAVQQAASEMGFTVLCAADGREGFASAVRVRPVAILTDLRLGDMDGREMVAAIRTDFLVRETPVLMLSGAELKPRLDTQGGAALAPVLKGLEQVLSPRLALYARLKARGDATLRGPVDPVGTTMLLRGLNAARLSGQLHLRHADGRVATLSLHRGEICGATVNGRCSAVGPLSMLHVFGCSWQQFSFTPVEQSSTGGQVSLGQLNQLIELACQQNNLLVGRVYRQGLQLEDVVVDRAALEAYLQQLAAPSRELLQRLADGEPAANLAAEGKLTAAFARSVLFDMRRRAVISATSLRPARPESVSEIPRPTNDVAAQPSNHRRWLIVAAAGFTTVVLAASAYVIFSRLFVR